MNFEDVLKAAQLGREAQDVAYLKSREAHKDSFRSEINKVKERQDKRNKRHVYWPKWLEFLKDAAVCNLTDAEIAAHISEKEGVEVSQGEISMALKNYGIRSKE